MTLDTFLIIFCLVALVVCSAGYRYFSENVYLTYVDQKVPQTKKGVKK